MDYKIFETLYKSEKISEDSFKKISSARSGPISLEWEIKSVLYLSIISLTWALAVIIYDNIETLGHAFVVTLIGLITFATLFYGLKMKSKYSWNKTENPKHLYDYIVLLGALSLITFIAYLQFRYELFGTKYGLASFITLVLLFLASYIFDHIGILSLAISNLALWLGITVTPKQLFLKGEYKTFDLILTGILLAMVLLVIGELSRTYKRKSHFRFTYLNFGVHLGFISILSAMFNLNNIVIWLLLLMIFTSLILFNAYKEKSFYFLMISSGYFYIGFSYFFISRTELFSFENDNALYLILFYFIVTSISLVFALIFLNKKLNEHL